MDRVPAPFAWECGLFLHGQASGGRVRAAPAPAGCGIALLCLGLYGRLGCVRKEPREWRGGRNISVVTDHPSMWLILETEVKSSPPIKTCS